MHGLGKGPFQPPQCPLVGRIVQRREIKIFPDDLFDLRIDDHGLVELLSPMHHPVTYGLDLFKGIQTTCLRVYKVPGQYRHRLGGVPDFFRIFNRFRSPAR